MNRRIVRRIPIWTIVGFFLLGCASPVFVTPPSSPVPGLVETIVAQTAAVAQTQTVINIPPSFTPTLTPLATRTITPTPSITPTILLITETSLPEGSLEEEQEDDEEDESGDVGSLVGGTSTSAPPKRPWDCRILSRYPAIGGVVTHGKPFDATYTLQNIGTQTWPKKGVDIVFYSGADLHEGRPYRDIPATVGPSGKVTISIPMIAPKRPGFYQNRWSLIVGNRYFCQLKLRIEAR